MKNTNGESFVVRINFGETIDDQEKIYCMLIDPREISFVIEFIHKIKFMFTIEKPIRLKFGENSIHELEDIKLLQFVDYVQVVFIEGLASQSRSVLLKTNIQCLNCEKQMKLIDLGHNRKQVSKLFLSKISDKFQTMNRCMFDEINSETAHASKLLISTDCVEEGEIEGENLEIENVSSCDKKPSNNLPNKTKHLLHSCSANKQSQHTFAIADTLKLVQSVHKSNDFIPEIKQKKNMSCHDNKESSKPLPKMKTTPQRQSTFSIADTLKLVQSLYKNDNLEVEDNRESQDTNGGINELKLGKMLQKRKRTRKHKPNHKKKCLEEVDDGFVNETSLPVSSSDLKLTMKPSGTHIIFNDDDDNNDEEDEDDMMGSVTNKHLSQDSIHSSTKLVEQDINHDINNTEQLNSDNFGALFQLKSPIVCFKNVVGPTGI